MTFGIKPYQRIFESLNTVCLQLSFCTIIFTHSTNTNGLFIVLYVVRRDGPREEKGGDDSIINMSELQRN